MTEEPCHGITPSLLPELEKLTLCSEDLSEDLEQPDTLKMDILGSLVCPKLREIVITHTESRTFEDSTYDFDTGDWATIDGFLVRLAEGANTRLKVELHVLESFNEHNTAVIGGFLPAFRKVGDFAIVISREAERHSRPFQ